jgi:hypothetical protein
MCRWTDMVVVLSFLKPAYLVILSNWFFLVSEDAVSGESRLGRIRLLPEPVIDRFGEKLVDVTLEALCFRVGFLAPGDVAHEFKLV